jgi:hypothetical protein
MERMKRKRMKMKRKRKMRMKSLLHLRQQTSSFAVSSSQSYDSSIMRTTEIDNHSQEGYVASDGRRYNFSHSEGDEEEEEDDDDYEEDD